MVNRLFVILAPLALVAGAIAANNPPLSGAWNIQSTGSAASTGELLFRMTPGDGGDPVEVTVNVRSGTDERGVARSIRQALGSQLAPDRFNVELGAGANVLVTDPRGKPNFSLELLDSDVDSLRVVVQSVTPAASPTVPRQEAPAAAPSMTPPANTAPGNTLPPAAPAPGSTSQPVSPPANPNGAGQSATVPAPGAVQGNSSSAPPPTR